MPFAVVRTSQARAAVDARMTGKDREAYRAAVEQLEGEGCRAGGYRLRGADSDDYPLCCKHLRGAWRMFTAYVDDGRIVIVAIDRHTPRNNPRRDALSPSPKSLATVGRRRDDKPPCCDDPASAPEMGDELREFLDSLL